MDLALPHTAVVWRPLPGVWNDQGLLKRAEAEDTGSICLSAGVLFECASVPVTNSYSWGPEVTGQSYTKWDGTTANMQIFDNVKNFFDTGVNLSESISFQQLDGWGLCPVEE